MRKIAFRAWDKCKNRMTYKVLVGNTDMSDPNYTCTTVLAEGGWVHDDGTCLDLMQFTGLKDKNGVEIYEGDITQYGVVKFSSSCFNIGGDRPLEAFKDLEVLGNIYEHPHLIQR